MLGQRPLFKYVLPYSPSSNIPSPLFSFASPLRDLDASSYDSSSAPDRSVRTRLTCRRQSRRLAIKPVDEDQHLHWESARQFQDIKTRI